MAAGRAPGNVSGRGDAFQNVRTRVNWSLWRRWHEETANKNGVTSKSFILGSPYTRQRGRKSLIHPHAPSPSHPRHAIRMNESRAKTCGEGECVCVCNFHHNICVLAALPVVMWHALCHNSLTRAAIRTCTASLRRWSSTCWPLSSSTSRTARELQPVVLGIAQEEDVLSPWSRRGPDPLSLFPSQE